MSGPVREVFPNTGKSSMLRQFIYGLIAIVCLETIVVGVVIYLVAPPGLHLLLILVLLLGLLVFAAYGFAKILRSAHLLSGDLLHLNMGRWFSCRLPLTLISSADRAFLTSFPRPDMLGIVCAREGERLHCLSRRSDVCCIRLKEPFMVKAPSAENRRNRRGLVREILINVDEPELFLQRISEAAAMRDKLPAGFETAPGAVGAAAAVKSFGVNAGDIFENTLWDERGRSVEAGNLQPSLQLDKLTRCYGSFLAVQDLNIEVYPGEIFGFLGANGAGKTTTIRMIAGLLQPTAGKVLVNGEELWKPGAKNRRLIGYVPDTPLVYERLTAREHLAVAGRLYNLPREGLRDRIEALLSMFDLLHWGDRLIATYSMGMRRKFSLALSLLHDPEVIIIDELTGAFDAPTLAEIKNILVELRERGKTIFLSTHVMDVAEKVCDRVAIIHRGRLKSLGAVKELCNSHGVEGGLEQLFLKTIATGREKQ